MQPPTSNTEQSLHADSWLVSAGRSHDVGSPLNVPLFPASNYVLGGELAYVRDNGTPAWDALEAILGGLEQGHAVAFASGLAAAAAVCDQLAVGAHVVLPVDCYQGVVRLTKAGEARGRWTVERKAIEDTSG